MCEFWLKNAGYLHNQQDGNVHNKITLSVMIESMTGNNSIKPIP